MAFEFKLLNSTKSHETEGRSWRGEMTSHITELLDGEPEHQPGGQHFPFPTYYTYIASL